MTQQRTSFARIILTPILLLIAAVAVGSVNADWLLPALLGAAVIGIGYILVASRR